jgi:hypothetical protein
MIRSLVSATIIATISISAANAQMVKSQITASNGIRVDLNSDDFANRYEYSAPVIDVSGSPSGFVLVGKVKNKGILGGMTLQGAIMYGGDWHYYSSAVYRGGDPVDYKTTSRKVMSCRYSCTFMEGFMIDLTPKDVISHAENGMLAIQIRAQASADVFMLQIPTTYIDAVNEVAK